MVDWSRFQQIYLFSSSNNPTGYSFQDNRVNKEGSSNSPLSEWPCFGPDGLKGKAKAVAYRVTNSLSDERGISGKKKENFTITGGGYSRHSYFFTSRASSFRLFVPTEYILCSSSFFRFGTPSAVGSCC